MVPFVCLKRALCDAAASRYLVHIYIYSQTLCTHKDYLINLAQAANNCFDQHFEEIRGHSDVAMTVALHESVRSFMKRRGNIY